MVLRFQRGADAQWQPFELHLARCTRWTAGVQFALGTGRATERGRVGGGPGASEREGYPRPQGEEEEEAHHAVSRPKSKLRTLPMPVILGQMLSDFLDSRYRQ